MKSSKKVIVSLFFAFLMLGSTIAYTFLQGNLKTGTTETTPPSTNVVGYELTADQETVLMQNGKTILKFLYNLACDGCIQRKNVLEGAVNDNTFSGQLVLEEILTNKTGLPMLTVLSYQGQRVLTNFTNEELVEALCDMMVQPPVGCAVRKV